MDQIAVLIPCYNEESTIEKVITDYRRRLPDSRIYVYDNNSTDRTAAIARESGAIVRRERQQGKGNVIRRMFREIDAQVYLLVDGDDTYPAEYAPEMVRLVLEEQADMVVGDRLSSTYFTENKRPFHNFGNLLVRKSINALFGCQIKDMMTGYRAFSYQFVKTFPVLSRGFEIETEMSIHAAQHHMQIENVVVDYRDRPDGSVSKLNTYNDGIRVLFTILNLFRNYRPLSFFSLLGFLLAVTAAAFFLPVLVTYAQIGLVPRFPTLIVCAFVAVAAVQCFFTGLVLDTSVKKNRQDFEMRLIDTSRQYKALLKVEEPELPENNYSSENRHRRPQ